MASRSESLTRAEWDQRVCDAYLETIFQAGVLSGAIEMAPGFLCPVAERRMDRWGELGAPTHLAHAAHVQHVEHRLPAETPQMLGLHATARVSQDPFETCTLPADLPPTIASNEC
eukprot:1178803-Prorocentrum_minimum.AAC.1